MKPRHAIGTARRLKRVPLFVDVPERALEELAAHAELRTVAAGQRVVAELETGEEALIVLRGSAKATVGGLAGDVPVELATVHVGDCIGEMALFTGELRSATVIATTRMLLLVIDRPRFERLLRQHPTTAAHLATVLAVRFRENQGVLATVLSPASTDSQRHQALLRAEGGEILASRPRRLWPGARIAWRELVVRHRRELPFLMLVAFVVTLIAVRGIIFLDRRLMPGAASVEALLRASYVSGLLLLCGTGATSLLYFRPRLRRTLAVVYGVGLALLCNALPVLLTFDLFYRDMVTRDPSLVFSVDVLYDRTEGANVVILTAAFLFQAVYLRRFYRHLAMLVASRGRSRAPDGLTARSD
jgi:CRP-like cAMP-binding protein